eukprot:gene4357-5360_t
MGRAGVEVEDKAEGTGEEVEMGVVAMEGLVAEGTGEEVEMGVVAMEDLVAVEHRVVMVVAEEETGSIFSRNPPLPFQEGHQGHRVARAAIGDMADMENKIAVAMATIGDIADLEDKAGIAPKYCC